MQGRDRFLLIDTAKFVGQRAEALGAAFYRELFARVPRAEELFAFDLHRRMHLMPEALIARVMGGRGVEEQDAALRSAHRIYGVSRGDFEAGKAAFAAALATTCADCLGAEAQAAWCAAYEEASDFMVGTSAPPLRVVG